MNARQLAKKYKKLTEINASKARVFDNMARQEAYMRMNQKVDIRPYKASFTTDFEEYGYIKHMLVKQISAMLLKEINVTEIDLGESKSKKYETLIYIGFEPAQDGDKN